MVAIVMAVVGTYIILKIVGAVTTLRADAAEEESGLDRAGSTGLCRQTGTGRQIIYGGSYETDYQNRYYNQNRKTGRTESCFCGNWRYRHDGKPGVWLRFAEGA